MPEGPAVDSFRYALNPELVKLYLAIFLGWFLIDFSQHGFMVLEMPFQMLLSLPFLLGGVALFIGGLVGALHRILSDTLPTTRSR